MLISKYFVTLFIGSLFVFSVFCDDNDKHKGEGVHYTIDDGIQMLDAETFGPTVYDSPVAWFVKFYSKWCGHCKTFAPTYKMLAKDIEEWRNVVRLGAVDCVSKSESGLDTGRKVCFKKPFFISGMPDFRFFLANGTDEDFAGLRRKYEGHKVYGPGGKIMEDSDSMEKVRESIVGFIQESNAKVDNPTFSLETLKKKDLEELIAEKTDGTHKVLIIESKASYVGRHVILDMTAFQGVDVYRVAKTNKKIKKLLNETYGFEFTSTPAVLLIKDEKSFIEFDVPDEQVEDPRTFIRTKLQSLPDVRRIREEKIIEKRNMTDAEDYKMADVDRSKVYMSDLEVAMHYSLRKEVSGVEYIQGRSLQALKDYVAVLVKYFPGRPSVMKFLERINKSVKDVLVTKMIVWGTWQETLEKSDEARGAYLTTNETYYGCSGSRPDLRGFPCSLWQLFHVLINQAYKYEPDGDWAIGVLITMQEYIANFFTCMECRIHWAAATDDAYDEVTDSAEAVLYLWSKHNEVNMRLSGGKTDDPMFPKSRWPTREMCPECWNENMEYDEANVFKFLVDFYSPNSITHDYVEDLKKSGRTADEL